jgi:multiple sugar transport system ATP-binding protein
MTNLIIKDLTIKYGDTVAVKGLNLDINDKEFVVLVGPSGCGKTTILNSIAGLMDISNGEIWFDDELVTSPEKGVFKIPQKRDVAMVFQDYAIYPHMSVFDNIAFPLEIRKVKRNDIEKKVKETAKLLKIEQYLDRKPQALSGGQRQRIALGRAMVRDPRIFLMDEPMANLDAKLRAYARVELKRIQKKLGITTIFVTHDQIEAMTMGDKIVVMNNGELEQIGKPEDLYFNPLNKFVAEFIGSPPINILEGRMVGKNGGVEVDLGFFIYRLSKIDKKLNFEKPLDIYFGIRPEDIIITDKNHEKSVKARVTYIEPIGKEYNVHLEIDGNIMIAVINLVGGLKLGQEVNISFKEEKIHIFDKKSGKTLL